MQDLWHSCTMLEKGAFKGCNAWYAMNNNMGVTTIGSWINFQACPTMRLSQFLRKAIGIEPLSGRDGVI